MATLKLTIVSARPTAQLQKFQVAGGKHAQAQRIINYLDSLQTGTELAASASAPPSINVVVQDAAVRASGTFTLATVIATNTVVINGVTFTCVASGATGNQFNVGASDTLTAVNLAAAINTSVTALVSGYVTASSSGAVVTVTSAFYGTEGNQCTISSGGATITASGARLTGGTADSGALTINF